MSKQQTCAEAIQALEMSLDLGRGMISESFASEIEDVIAIAKRSIAVDETHTPEFCTKCGVHSVVAGTKTCDQCAEFVETVESPDDWIEITDDNHMPRDGVDWLNGGSNGSWIVHEPRHVRSTLGEYKHSWPAGKFRCRRRDLPPIPSWYVEVTK